MVSQERIEVTVFRRANNRKPEVLTNLNSTVLLESIELNLPLSVIYEGISVG